MEPTDRKTLIADAALTLLSAAGARGLTHRGVDAEAALPQGSTSFYFRTRLDLLRAAVQRHAALDLTDLAQDAHCMAQPDWKAADRIVDTLRKHGIDRLTLDVRHEALVHARARRTHECETRGHRSVPFIRRPSAFAISSFESRSAIACRLSAFLRPRATPSSTFTRPSLK